MTPIKDLLWLAETSLHWLWQILMSNSDELNTGNITDRELKIDWTKFCTGDIKICHCYLRAKNRYCNTDWFLVYISQVKCFSSEFVHSMRTAFNPFMPNGISHCDQLEQSISVWRGVRCFFHFYSSFNRKSCKQTVETLIRRRILWHLIWVCTICLCPTKRTLGIYGLKFNYFAYLIRWEVYCWNNLPRNIWLSE